jgi:hypothetical protein
MPFEASPGWITSFWGSETIAFGILDACQCLFTSALSSRCKIREMALLCLLYEQDQFSNGNGERGNENPRRKPTATAATA